MTDKSKSTKFCPLMSVGTGERLEPCHEDYCPWWDSENRCCVMLTLGRGLLASRGFSGGASVPQPMSNPPQPAPQAQPEKVRCSDCKFYSPPKAGRWWAFCRNYGLWMPPDLIRVCDDFEPAKKDEQGSH
jgi:hypothetical protein